MPLQIRSGLAEQLPRLSVSAALDLLDFFHANTLVIPDQGRHASPMSYAISKPTCMQ